MLKNKFVLSLILIVFVASFTACNEPINPNKVRKLTFALTNDIHGHLEPQQTREGPKGDSLPLQKLFNP